VPFLVCALALAAGATGLRRAAVVHRDLLRKIRRISIPCAMPRLLAWQCGLRT